MARKRMIDPKFWSDDKMMSITPMHRLLFIGIWNFSDDSGIHKNSNEMLKAEIFPCDDITINQIGKLKSDLIDHNLIVPFQNEEIELFYVKNWNIYQKINRPIPTKYRLNEDSRRTHGALTPNRIEQNRIKQKREQDKHSLTTDDLNTLADKHPKVDVQGSYRKFELNLQKKNRASVNEMAEFELWLIRDEENEWNKRIKSNDSVTIYCPDCDKEKIVSEGPQARETICDCETQMLRKNDYLHEKERLR